MVGEKTPFLGGILFWSQALTRRSDRFKVEDETRYYRDVLAAWACIRLDRLRQGYRFIELMDAKGNASDGKLFVRIEKTVR